MLENNSNPSNSRALANRFEEDGGGSGMLPAGAARAPLALGGAGAGGDRPTTSILTIIWRRRWVFFGCIVLSLAASVAYLSKCIPVYSAASQVYVQQSAPKLITDVLNSGANSGNYFYTQCDIIRSTAVLSAALDGPGVRQAKSLRDSTNPVAFLKANTDANVGKQSDIITVSVESPHPEDSALFANAVTDAYIEYQHKQQRSTASDFLKILQKEKDKHEQELRATNQAMLEFKRANGTLSFESDKGNIITQRLAELSDALTRAQLEALDAKVLVDAVTAMGDDPIKLKQLVLAERSKAQGGPVGAMSDNQDLWQDYRRLERAAQQARKVYGPEHALVKQYEAQLETLKLDIADLDGATAANYKAVIQQQHVKAQTKVNELQKELDIQRGLAMDLNGKAAQYQQLETDARRNQNALDMLYTRIKELNFSEDTPLSISVLEVARPNGTPVKPKRSQTMGIALVIGLMLGLGGSLLQDWMDQRMRSVEEIRAVLDLPVLGIVPNMPGKLAPSDRGQEVHLRPRSTVAEAYRTVRTAIYFGVPDPKSKTLLVTSPSPGDGKTTMASNLAIAIAQSGRRVLLIDADTRKPMMHKIFQLNDDVGLSSVLLGEAKLDKAIQKTGAPNLEVLPCGPLPPNPSEILNSQAFLDLVNSLCLQYDQIVIDSPPVEPVTDARILAASCDTTVLVLRAEKSTRRLSAHARDALIGVGANLLGVIVNAVPRGQGGYTYYSGYGYYHYGYGQRHSSGNGSNGNGSNGHSNGSGSNGNGSGHKEIKAITVAHEES